MTTTQTTPSTPSATGPLDRTLAPSVPDAVADLWDGWGYNGSLDPDAVRIALDGVTSIVNALSGGETYRVALTGTSTAYTDLKARSVAITTAALADQRLTLGERLGVTSAMAIHEAGHARLTAPMSRAMARAYPASHPQHAAAVRLSNITEDVRLESRTSRDYPEFGGLFPLCMWWVAQRYPSGRISSLPRTQGEAVNLALAAIRYGDLTTWDADPALQAERAFWIDWGQRAASTDKPAEHVAAIGEALARIASLPTSAPSAPEDGPGGSEPGESEPGESETEGEGEPGESEPTDEDGEAEGAEDADGEGEGAPGEGDADDDEDTDTDTDTEPEGEDEGEGSESEPGETTYHHREDAGTDDGTDTEPDSTDSTVYGANETPDYDPSLTDDGRGIEQDERDALADPLPLHGADAVTGDDRNRDIAIGRTIAAQVESAGKDEVIVTHADGSQVRVGIEPIETTRQRIVTDPDTQGMIRSAFTAQRTQHEDRDTGRSGRVSGHRAYRIAAGFDNVFTRRGSPSPDLLDVHLLVDSSGSMGTNDRWGSPTRMQMAAQMAANITEALAALPYVRVHVWSHASNYRGTVVRDVYDTRRDEPLGRIAGIKAFGGNNDASALGALTAQVLAERTNRERSIIIVISDGAPCEDPAWVRGAVENARTEDVGVVSVAIAGGLTSTQEACYGPDYVVSWTGDWDDLSRNMATIIGRLA